jgi:hypothetical protein
MASNPAASAAPKDPVASIAGQIAYLSTGDRAQLRRIYLTGRHEADGVVIRLLHRADVTVPQTPEAFRPWRLLAHCAALLSGTAAVQPHTAVRGDALDAQVIRAVRMLAQRGEGPANLWTLFDLVGNDETRAEAARLRIAQDYYAAKARSDKGDDA